MAKSDQNILSKCRSYKDSNQAMGAFFFHGTSNLLLGDLRPGGFDGVFWCANSPAIAQNYISTGTKALITKDMLKLRDRVSPSKFGDGMLILKSMGFCESQFDVEYDDQGRMRSYRLPKGHPTYQEAYDWLEKGKGYTAARGIYKVLIDTWGDQATIKDSSEKMVGRLVILEKDKSFRWLDLRQGDAGDLQLPDHLKLKQFQSAEERGFDGGL